MDLDPNQQNPDARRDIAGILLQTIRTCELNLGSKERTDAAGARLSPKDYQIWRRKTIKFMNHATEKYRQYRAIEKKEKSNEYAAKQADSTCLATEITLDRAGETV